MAIDTSEKRLRCLDYEEAWAEAMPIPDGFVSTADRYHLIWSYSAHVTATIPGCVTGTDASLYVVSLADALFGTITLTDSEPNLVTAVDALFGDIAISDAAVMSATVSDTACGIDLPVELEDLTAYWVFEDDSIMEWA